MKHFFLFSLLFVFTLGVDAGSFQTLAQHKLPVSDEEPIVVTLLTGKKIKAKFVKVINDSISYQPLKGIDKQVVTIPTTDVFMIRYADGRKVILNASPQERELTNKETDEVDSAIADANKYYKLGLGTSALLVTLLTTLLAAYMLGPLGMILGLIPAIFFSFSPTNKFKIPKGEQKSKVYKDAYRNQLQVIQMTKAWLGLGIVISAALLFWLFLFLNQLFFSLNIQAIFMINIWWGLGLLVLIAFLIGLFLFLDKRK